MTKDSIFRAAAPCASPASAIVEPDSWRRSSGGSPRLHEAILNHLSDPVFLTDDAGAFTFVCANVRSIFGRSAEEVRALGNVARLFGEGFFDRHELERTGELRNLEWSGPDAGGRPRTLLINIHRADIEGGTRLFVCRDITSLRLADCRAMESTLVEREAQLRQTQKMEAIGQLAGGVAHDFNNLLTMILGNTEIARDPALAPQEREQLLMEVDAAGGRAAALTRKLLAFSRRQVLEPVEVNMNELVADAAKLLRRLIGENIAISLSLADDLGRVLVDRAQLEQIVFNLSVNARDAMPDGGRLTLETRNADADALPPDFPRELAAGPYVMLAVSDTGCGIPDEVKPRLFEPFFTTKPKGHGTGMGLAMVFGTVTQSQGHISVSSEVGRGTTFGVYFPRVRAASREETPRDVDPILGCGGERILLVEDDEAVRVLAQRILETSGYDVLAASCPSEALTLLAHDGGDLDLLLTDVIMPEMSGRDLAKLVQERRRQVRVLYTSGHSNSLIARHGVLDDDAVFLEKPFTRDSLTAKVRDALAAPMLCEEPALAS